MNKAELAEAVSAVLGGTKASAEQAVETMIETITKSLKKGEDVYISVPDKKHIVIELRD